MTQPPGLSLRLSADETSTVEACQDSDLAVPSLIFNADHLLITVFLEQPETSDASRDALPAYNVLSPNVRQG